MVLRNYCNYIASCLLGIASTDTTTFGDGHINTKTMSGGIKALEITHYRLISTGFFSNILMNTFISGMCYLAVGNGTTPVTFDDYTLASRITSGLSLGTVVHGTPIYNSLDHSFTNTAMAALTNTSEASITVNEIGLVATTNTAINGAILIYREVLDNPFTINARQTVTYTHSFKFTMPTIN